MIPRPDRRSRVLLLRALGLGDFLTGVPAYRAVRKAFPEHEIVLAAPGPLAELAELTGAVDRLLPTGELEPVRWPHAAPDLAIDLHGNGPASRQLLEALRPVRLVGFGGRRAADRGICRPGPRWLPAEHEVRRWCRLLSWHGIPADPADLDLEPPHPARPWPDAFARPVLVHPGAAAPSRRWPPSRFAAVAAHLDRSGRRVLVTGSAAERPLAEQVAAAAGLPADAVVAGRTSVSRLASIVADAAVVVSGDTGIAHLATALRTPSVILFGPVPPQEWGPPPQRPWHISLHAAGPSYHGDPHGAVLDPALAAIDTGDVIAAVGRILASYGHRATAIVGPFVASSPPVTRGSVPRAETRRPGSPRRVAPPAVPGRRR